MNQQSILIVDDQKFNLDILLGVLGEAYKLRIAMDGETALNLANNDPPDLVLLDVDLPGISGYDVCRALKTAEHTRGVAVIFLTGLGDPESEVLGLSLGALDFITKPFNPVLVKARVDSHLALLQAHRELLEHREKLERNERLASLGRLLAGLAHELNTPLGNALLANSSLAALLEQPADPGYVQRFHQLIQLADRNLRHASDLVEQVRQALANRDDIPVGTVNIHSLLQHVVATHNKGYFQHDVPPFLTGLQTDIFCTKVTVLGDIVSLMITRSFSGGRAHGNIGIHHSLDERGYLHINYHDDGPGLGKTELQNFFEPSFWSTAQVASTGLATFVMYSLAVYHLKGTLTVESPDGKGIGYQLKIPPASPEDTGVPNDSL